MKNIATVSAAMMVAPTLFAMENALKADAGQLGGLASFILFEDCVKLILESPQFSVEFKNALKGDIRKELNGNIARLAGVLPKGEEHIPKLLKQLAQTADKKDVKRYDEKLAFALGWIILKASSKEIVGYNQKLIKNNHRIEEIRTYQDTQLIRSRFGRQSGTNLSGEQFSTLMLQFIMRVVTRIHTVNPDRKNGGDWIIRITEWRVQNKKIMEIYGTAIENPDPSKLNLYYQKCNFYNPEDPLIANNFKTNNLTKQNSCMYAKALINGYNAVLGVQSFMNGKGDMDTVMRLV